MDNRLQKIYNAAVIAFLPYGWRGFFAGFIVVLSTIIVSANYEIPFESFTTYFIGCGLSLAIIAMLNRKTTWFKRRVDRVDEKTTTPFMAQRGKPILDKHPLVDKTIGHYVGVATYFLTFTLVHQTYYLPFLSLFIIFAAVMLPLSMLTGAVVSHIHFRRCADLDEERQFILECLTVDDPTISEI